MSCQPPRPTCHSPRARFPFLAASCAFLDAVQRSEYLIGLQPYFLNILYRQIQGASFSKDKVFDSSFWDYLFCLGAWRAAPHESCCVDVDSSISVKNNCYIPEEIVFKPRVHKIIIDMYRRGLHARTSLSVQSPSLESPTVREIGDCFIYLLGPASSNLGNCSLQQRLLGVED